MGSVLEIASAILNKTNTFSDTINILIKSSFEYFKQINEVLIAFLTVIQGIKAIFEQVSGIFKLIIELVKSTKDLFSELRALVKIIINMLNIFKEKIPSSNSSTGEKTAKSKSSFPIDTFTLPVDIITTSLKVFNDNVEMVEKFAANIELVTVAFNLLSASPVVLLITTIAFIIIYLVGVFKELYKSNETFRNAVDTAWNYICAVFQVVWDFLCEIFQGIIDYFVRLWTENENFRLAIETAWNIIVSLFLWAWETIAGFFMGLINFFVQLWTENETFRTAIEVVWNFIVGLFIWIWEVISGILKGLINFFVDLCTKNTAFKTVVEFVWNSIKSFFDLIINAIVNGPIGILVKAFIDLFTQNEEVKKNFETVWNAICSFIGNIAEKISGFLLSPLKRVQELLGLLNKAADKEESVRGIGGGGKHVSSIDDNITVAQFKGGSIVNNTINLNSSNFNEEVAYRLQYTITNLNV